AMAAALVLVISISASGQSRPCGYPILSLVTGQLPFVGSSPLPLLKPLQPREVQVPDRCATVGAVRLFAAVPGRLTAKLLGPLVFLLAHFSPLIVRYPCSTHHACVRTVARKA